MMVSLTVAESSWSVGPGTLGLGFAGFFWPAWGGLTTGGRAGVGRVWSGLVARGGLAALLRWVATGSRPKDAGMADEKEG